MTVRGVFTKNEEREIRSLALPPCVRIPWFHAVCIPVALQYLPSTANALHAPSLVPLREAPYSLPVQVDKCSRPLACR
jgi:hypothetical protein